jgi:hypothetical protein
MPYGPIWASALVLTDRLDAVRLAGAAATDQVGRACVAAGCRTTDARAGQGGGGTVDGEPQRLRFLFRDATIFAVGAME